MEYIYIKNINTFHFSLFTNLSMYKKKGFSFLEILIVIMVIWILFISFRWSFTIKNKDIFYGQACIETIYGEVNNFLYTAMSSKSVNSWWEQIFPDTYSIQFSGQSITLGYQTSEDTYAIYRDILISGNTSNYCNDNTYNILMSGDTYTVYISKWLQGEQWTNFFLSGASSIHTWGNTFLQCDSALTGCKTIAYFESDTKILHIKKQMCLTTNEAGECEERDN